MAQNRFQAYLKERLPFGESVDFPFVLDAVADGGLPDPTSWEELEGYIKQRNPDTRTDVLNAAEYVWQLYIKER